MQSVKMVSCAITSEYDSIASFENLILVKSKSASQNNSFPNWLRLNGLSKMDVYSQ